MRQLLRNILVILLLLLVLFGVWQIVVIMKDSAFDTPLTVEKDTTLFNSESFKSALLLSKQGKYTEAADTFRPLLQEGKGTPDSLTLSFGVASNDFLSADATARLNAVRVLKEQFVQPTMSNTDKVLVINKLLDFNTHDIADRVVFPEIFTGEPFESLKVGDDHSASLLALAQYSNTLSPSVDAHFYIAKYHAEQCVNSSVVERQEHVDAVLANIQSMEVASKKLVSRIPEKARFINLQKIILYTTLARCDSQYLEEAQSTLVSLEDEYRKLSVDSTIGHSVEQLIAVAHMYIAEALYIVDGTDALKEVEDHLTKTVNIVNANPSLHGGLYLFLQEIQSLSPEDRQKIYPTYKVFVERVPVFKNFLQERGFVF